MWKSFLCFCKIFKSLHKAFDKNDSEIAFIAYREWKIIKKETIAQTYRMNAYLCQFCFLLTHTCFFNFHNVKNVSKFNFSEKANAVYKYRILNDFTNT